MRYALWDRNTYQITTLTTISGFRPPGVAHSPFSTPKVPKFGFFRRFSTKQGCDPRFEWEMEVFKRLEPPPTIFAPWERHPAHLQGNFGPKTVIFRPFDSFFDWKGLRPTLWTCLWLLIRRGWPQGFWFPNHRVHPIAGWPWALECQLTFLQAYKKLREIGRRVNNIQDREFALNVYPGAF